MTPQQQKWVSDHRVRSSDILHDDVGHYVIVTLSTDGTQSKYYIPYE